MKKMVKFLFTGCLLLVKLTAYDTIIASVRDQGVCQAAVAMPGPDGSVIVNPAGMLTSKQKTCLNAEYGRYNLKLNLLNLGFFQNLKYLGFGINYSFLGAADLAGIKVVNGQILKFNNIIFNINSGLPRIFKAGVNLQINKETLNAVDKTTVAVSLGSRFRLGETGRLGVSFNNLGGRYAHLHYGIGFHFTQNHTDAFSQSDVNDKQTFGNTAYNSIWQQRGRPGVGIPGNYGGSRGSVTKSSGKKRGGSVFNMELGLVHFLSDFNLRAFRAGLEWYFIPQFGMRGGLEIGIKYDKIAFDFGLVIKIKAVVLNYTFKRTAVFNQNLVGLGLEF